MKVFKIAIIFVMSQVYAYAERPIKFNTLVTGQWNTRLHSVHRGVRYNAQYYTFVLRQPANLMIDLISAADTYLYLLEGNNRHGTIIEQDDDGYPSGHSSRITRTLPAGTYTIEATTYNEHKLGKFLVRIHYPNMPSPTVMTFFGEDLEGEGLSKSTRAKQNFFSNITSGGTENFESYKTGTEAPLKLQFGTAGSATLTGYGYIEYDETSSNQKPVSGHKFWQAETGDFTIHFSKPISAFGCYITDIGDDSGTLEINYTNNTTKKIIISSRSHGGVTGSTTYFAFIEKDLKKAFHSIKFINTTSNDYFGFDDMTIATRAQINKNKYIVKNDFNGDGVADILMRNKYTGQYSIHYMLANGSRGRYQYGLNVPLKFTIVGTNDFNGDGITDILWRNKNTGQYVLYYMLPNGDRGRYKYSSCFPKYYSVQDTNDFNGDGIADILWRNNNTGQYLIYYMLPNGTRGRYKFGTVVPKKYILVDTNDFNGDGIADILWRNKYTGQYLIFFMNSNGSRKSYKFGTTVPTKYAFLDSNDFNGDGITDILWRNKNTGQYLIFYMNANGQRVRYKYGSTVPRSWSFKATGDYNRDGIADILWRSRINGQYLIFFMNADGSRKSYKYGFIIPDNMKIELK